MGDNGVSRRAAGSRRSKALRVRAAAAGAAVIVLAGTACSTVTSGAAARARAPAVIVLKQGANNGNGDIFITPAGGSLSGPEIISNTGQVIWFHPLPAHELAADFRAQTYQGKPVLTWWQGPPNLGAVSAAPTTSTTTATGRSPRSRAATATRPTARNSSSRPGTRR